MENSIDDIILKEIKSDNILNNYNEELKKDTNISKFNIKQKALGTSALRCKWLNYYIFEKDNLSKLLLLRKKYTENTIKSKNISDPLVKIKAQVALENSDEKMVKVDEMIKSVKVRIEFLERVQNIMNDFGFSIKNAVELYKMEGSM